MGELRHFPCRCQLLREPGDALVDEIAAQAPGDEVQVGARGPGARGERAGKPLANLIEPLQQGRIKRLRLGPTASGQLEALAPTLDAPRQAMPGAVLELAELSRQLGANRHGDLCRGGRRRSTKVRCEIDQSRVGLMADRGDERDCTVGRGAHHLFLIERPQILDRAATARDDQQVGPRFDRRKAANRVRDPGRRALPLHRHRPQDNVGGAALREAVEDVADYRARRRCHHADHARQERQPALARSLEQAFRGKRPAALLEQGEERALPRKLHPFDDDLIFGPAGIDGELARRDHLGAVLGPEGKRSRAAPPDHRVDARALVLEREIAVAGCVTLEAADLAAHPDFAECRLDGPFERTGQLADAERRRIVAGGDVR